MDSLSIDPTDMGNKLLHKESTMSDILNGLASQMPIQRFLSDYMDRSGFLDYWGWSPSAQEALVVEVGRLIDTEQITVEPDPGCKAMVMNGATRLTAQFKVCMDPKPMRHGARSKNLCPAIVEEMEFLNNTKWHLNQRMMQLLAGAKTEKVKALLRKIPNFFVAADEVGTQGFYTPVFYDRVFRSYHEGIFSPTGSKIVRACLDMEPDQYTVGEARHILSLRGLAWQQKDAFFQNWEDHIDSEGDFDILRAYLFLQEVEETGRSGYSAGGDITTSGPLLGSIVAGDPALMWDCNLGGEDNRDCRETISRRIVVPQVLAPWESFIRSRSAAKPLITRLYYGESGANGAKGMLWDNPDKAPLGWINGLGIVNEVVCIKDADKFNADYEAITLALGPKGAFAAYKLVSESYNSSFWRSYPRVLELRQKLSALFENAKKNGIDPYFTAPNGAIYTHHKWEIDNDSPSRWRFRHKSPKLTAWKHGIDITLAGMKDVAGPHSLFVRIIHFLDAWFKNRVVKKVKALQKKLKKLRGMATIHDCFILPAWMLPMLHGIVRGVLHEAVEKLPKLMNEFLVRYGQEPMKELTEQEKAKIHRNIKRNRAFLKLS